MGMSFMVCIAAAGVNNASSRCRQKVPFKQLGSGVKVKVFTNIWQ
jgi:hypothetical protein